MFEPAEPSAPVGNAHQVAFRDRLLDAGVLTPSGVRGLYGQGSSFVAAYDALESFVTATGRPDGPEVFRFPAVFPAAHLVRSNYLESFPDLVGTIHGFDGGNKEHATLIATSPTAPIGTPTSGTPTS